MLFAKGNALNHLLARWVNIRGAEDAETQPAEGGWKADGKEWCIDERRDLHYNSSVLLTERSKNVKRIKYPVMLLALALVLNLTACGLGEKKFERGTVEGQTYTNAFLGLTCTAPSEYTYLNDEEIAELNGLDTAAASGGTLLKEMQALLEGGGQVQDMYLMTEDRVQTVNVMVTGVETKGAAVDMSAFADTGVTQIKTSYEATAGMSDVEAVHESVSFMGQTYEGVRMTALYEGNAPVYCTQVYMQKGDYVCVINFTSYVEDHTEEMMAFFSAVEAK